MEKVEDINEVSERTELPLHNLHMSEDTGVTLRTLARGDMAMQHQRKFGSKGPCLDLKALGQRGAAVQDEGNFVSKGPIFPKLTGDNIKWIHDADGLTGLMRGPPKQPVEPFKKTHWDRKTLDRRVSALQNEIDFCGRKRTMDYDDDAFIKDDHVAAPQKRLRLHNQSLCLTTPQRKVPRRRLCGLPLPGKSLQPRPNFLSLPAEIRSSIYEEVALCSKLTIGGDVDHVYNPLLRACKQTREEYVPIMCAFMPIDVHIHGWYFKNVKKFLQRVTEPKLKMALHHNASLRVVIWTAPWHEASPAEVQAWLDFRAYEGTLLTWEYTVEPSIPGYAWKSQAGFLWSIGLPDLRQMRDQTTSYADNLELDKIIKAFEEEGDHVEEALMEAEEANARSGRRLWNPRWVPSRTSRKSKKAKRKRR